MTTPIELKNPRICISPDGDTIAVHFQDPTSREALVIAHVPRSLAAALAAEFQSVALPSTAAPFRLDEDGNLGNAELCAEVTT